MANVKNPNPHPGTEWYTLDTTADISLGDASQDSIGSFLVQVEGNAWTGTLNPQGRLLGAAAASVGWIALAYQDLNTGNDVAGGTTISTDGLYAIRADVGMEVKLVYTDTAGAVDILIRRGIG